MAAELEKDFNASVDLIPSMGGVFEVRAEGDLLFSKKSLGRFPEDGEVAGLLKAR